VSSEYISLAALVIAAENAIYAFRPRSATTIRTRRTAPNPPLG